MARRKPLRGYKPSGFHPNKTCKVFQERAEGHGPAGALIDVRDVEKCADVCGSHFFDADTKRFFNSRIGQTAYVDGKGGAYFTTSEKGPDGNRRYSVRYYDPKRCGVETHGKFQQYGSSATANTAAKRAAVGGGLGRRRRR